MLCKKFEIGKETLCEYLNNKKSFTSDELLDEILGKGGAFRIGPAIPIKKALSNLVDRNVLYYSSVNREYQVVDFSNQKLN